MFKLYWLLSAGEEIVVKHFNQSEVLLKGLLNNLHTMEETQKS